MSRDSTFTLSPAFRDIPTNKPEEVLAAFKDHRFSVEGTITGERAPAGAVPTHHVPGYIRDAAITAWKITATDKTTMKVYSFDSAQPKNKLNYSAQYPMELFATKDGKLLLRNVVFETTAAATDYQGRGQWLAFSTIFGAGRVSLYDYAQGGYVLYNDNGAIPNDTSFGTALGFDPPQNSVFKGSGPAVYLFHGGVKHHLTSQDVLIGGGFDWKDVVTRDDDTVNALPIGTPLNTAADCLAVMQQ